MDIHEEDILLKYNLYKLAKLAKLARLGPTRSAHFEQSLRLQWVWMRLVHSLTTPLSCFNVWSLISDSQSDC